MLQPAPTRLNQPPYAEKFPLGSAVPSGYDIT